MNTRRKIMLVAALGLAFLLQGAPGPGAAKAGQGKALKELDLGLAYVQRAWVAESGIQGMMHKTLCVEFKRPTAALSTLEGYKIGVRRVANHYVPHGAWKGLAMQSVPQLLDIFWRSLGYGAADGAMLITGADMDNLALARASSDGVEVVALVTAGVRGNAMRAGFDEGKHLEPGTINAIIISNRKLSPRAMTRAMIGVTEAKAAAL
ncbi:MAG: adenosylcobinamide amidohydrolase, partial [Pseudomonadota bacterium]